MQINGQTKAALLIFLFLLTLISPLPAQERNVRQITVAFYNTENIFDTIDDPAKEDEDFLPSAKVAWTAERYTRKLNQIARVITAIDSLRLPEIVGLAEVENMQVLKDLVMNTGLSRGRYNAILEEGSDPRGIDVALIYRPEVVRYISHQALPSARSFSTRNLLYVQLADMKKDTFHIFVNHWKSRSGGAAETEPKRMENAAMLRHVVDSVMNACPGARILIMGDLNDEPSDKSVATELGALKPERKFINNKLYNLHFQRYLNGEGTLYYKDWDLFDQIIVSGNMLNKKQSKSPVIRSPYSFILKKEWMLYKNKAGERVPNRTAGSREYFGGFSDHLPVYTIISY